MPRAFLQYDVFTSEPLTGNQLAVFPDGTGLSTPRMQAIAREMNFSETTFILPAEAAGTDVRMRIFTPWVELPMAGHPTIGSTFALAHLGVVVAGSACIVFGLNIGPTPVDLVWNGGTLQFAWMTQRLPEFGEIVGDRTAAAGLLGLDVADLHPSLPVQQVSCGVPYAIVPLRSHDAVDRATTDMAAIRRLGTPPWLDHGLLLFAPGDPKGPESMYSRMLAPQIGIAEDPATGSAAGPLGCYLVKHGAVDGDGQHRIVIAQGVQMRRPSRLLVDIGGTRSVITSVKVGGEAVLVATGELLPA